MELFETIVVIGIGIIIALLLYLIYGLDRIYGRLHAMLGELLLIRTNSDKDNTNK